MNIISFLFVFFFRVFFYFQWKIEFVPSWRGKGPVFYMTIDVNRLLLQWRVGVQYSGTMYKTWGWKILVSSEGEIWWRNERTWVFRKFYFPFFFSSAFILKRNIRVIQRYFVENLKDFLIICSLLQWLRVEKFFWWFLIYCYRSSYLYWIFFYDVPVINDNVIKYYKCVSKIYHPQVQIKHRHEFSLSRAIDQISKFEMQQDRNANEFNNSG